MEMIASLISGHPFWVWMGIGAVFLAAEVMSGSGWMLWPAGSAALTGVAAAFLYLNGAAQVAVFAVLTILTTYLGRRYLRPALGDGDDVNDPLTRLVGHHGQSVEPFTGLQGRVFVDGKEWSAELDGPGPLAAGARVEVVAVLGGARLKVRAA